MFIPFLRKFSYLVYNITLTVLRMAGLKLSSGMCPLMLRKLCQIILIQPEVVRRL